MAGVTMWDPVGSRQKGAQAAQESMRAQGMRQTLDDSQTMRGIAQQAGNAPGGYDIERHASLLEQSGFTDSAIKLRQIKSKEITDQAALKVTALQVLRDSIPVMRAVGPHDPTAVDNFAGMVEAAGFSKDIPREFGADFTKMLDTMENNVKNIEEKWGPFEQIQGLPQGTMGQPSQSTGKYTNIQTPDTKGGKIELNVPNQVQTQMRQIVSASKGGLYNPRTGEITGLSPDEYGQYLTVLTIAGQIWQEANEAGQQISASQAVQTAERLVSEQMKAQGQPGANIPPVRGTPGAGVDQTNPLGFDLRPINERQ